MKIKGYIPKKKEEPKKNTDLAAALLGTTLLFTDMEQLKVDVTNVVETELEKIEKTHKEIKETTEKSIQKIDDKVAEFEETAIELIKDIKQIPTIKGEKGDDADEEAIEERLTAKIPKLDDFLSKVEKLDEDKLLKKFIKQIPESKADLKIIKETFQLDPMTVVETIQGLPTDKFQLKMANISGLDETLRLVQRNGKGYVHGGGFNNIYSSSTLVSNGLTGLNFTGSGVNSVTKDNVTGIITVDISGGGGGTPGGLDTQLQYNNAGSFGGISGATTNGTSVTYTTGNLLGADIKASSSGGLQILSTAGTVTALFGAGSGANSTFYGGMKGDYLTASEILITDASKNIVSAAVATYPSLTELTYLKGVTSAIQTQLNAKQATLVSGTNIKTINGTSLLGSGDIVIDATVTLADLSSNSTTAITSRYTMTSTIPVEFRAANGVTLMYLDETNKRVGFGTTTPSQTLSLAFPNSNNWAQLDRSSTSYESAFQWTTGGTPSFFLGMRNVSPNTGLHLYDYTAGRDVMVLNAGGDIVWNQGGFFNIVALAGSGTRMVTADASGTLSTTAIPTGTVTSVGWTGGIVSVATATTTPAFTIAGTSGGIPYFSSASTWASSAALAANAIVIGGGAGVAPSTTTTGTGVLTALGINVGSAGAFVTFNGALGTPSSGTVTNLTGTASININGTVGATTPGTGAFTTLSASSTLTASTTIELGHASDTTLSRVSAGVGAIEGSQITTLNTTALSGNQTVTLAVKTRYLLSVGLYETQNMTLPATFAVGDEIHFIINSTSNAGTVNVILAASDNFLYVGDAGTTVSTTSNFVCNRNSSFKLVCTVANTTWEVVDICGAGGSFGGTNISAIGYSIPLASGSIMFTDAFQTVINKRNQPRQSSAASGDISPNLATANMYIRTNLAATCTINAPTGSPVNGEELVFRLRSTAIRTLTWNATYVVVGTTLPAATVANKLIYVRCIYNSTQGQWDVVQVNSEV